MTTNLRDLALTPRAIAALVALRKGPRSIGSLADSLADDITSTRSLMSLLCGRADAAGRWVLVQRYNGRSSRETYGLTHDGIGWLQSQGLDATADAKQALYAATDAQARKAGAL